MKTTETLAELMLESPSSAIVFERYNLDYCCGGKDTLDAACQKAGLSTEMVMEKLLDQLGDANSSTFHPSMWDTSMLIGFIEQNHHRYLRSALPSIQSAITKVATKHGDKFPETIAIAELIEDLANELTEHMLDEERGVFSVNRKMMTTSDVRTEIAVHEADHNSVGRKLLRLKAITGGFIPPPNACATHRAAYAMIQEFVRDTMQHVFLENSVLFPKLLQEAQQQSTTTI